MANLLATRRGILTRTAGVLGAGALAAACGQQAGPSGDKIKQGTSTREVTLLWSTWGNDQNISNTDAVPKGLPIFNQRFPKIKITVLPESTNSWQERNEAMWLAGNGPDLSEHCCQWGPVWARQGLFLNLDANIKKDFSAKIKDDFVSWLMDLFRDQEHGQFALPMYTGTIGLYYHKSLFQKKGVPLPDDTWDWNKYRDAAIRLTDPQTNTWGRRQIRGYDRILQRIHQAGGHYVDPKDDKKCVLDSAQAMQALQYERDANIKDKVTVREQTSGRDQFNATTGMNLFQAISAQRFAMWEEGSWNLVNSTKQVERDVVPQWDVAPLPKGPGGRDTLATNDGWSIWKGSKAIDEAWELLKFLESDEWYEIDSSIVGHQPPRKSFQDQWLKLIKQANPALADKNLKIFTDAIGQNYARPIELFRRHKDSEDMIARAADAMFNQAMYYAEIDSNIKNGEKALDAAVKEVVAKVNDFNSR